MSATPSDRTVRPRVKICGVTRREDALLAGRLGADAIGLQLLAAARSATWRPPPRARIVRALPPLVTAVGVFVNPTRDEVLRAVEASGVAVVQLHGDEPPELCASLPFPVVKAIRVTGPASLAALLSYEVQGFLLDAPGPGFGGSGTSFDWSLAAEAAASVPVLLAGGLTPENVAEAIRAVRPWGVDVASGVEVSPGVKDPEKLRRFIVAAKEQP